MKFVARGAPTAFLSAGHFDFLLMKQTFSYKSFLGSNTWHNRLAYDASLPEAGRKTWTISAPKTNSPVKLAGLVGPVQVRVGKVVNLL